MPETSFSVIDNAQGILTEGEGSLRLILALTDKLL